MKFTTFTFSRSLAGGAAKVSMATYTESLPMERTTGQLFFLFNVHTTHLHMYSTLLFRAGGDTAAIQSIVIADQMTLC
jgi:hypothetical protein